MSVRIFWVLFYQSGGATLVLHIKLSLPSQKSTHVATRLARYIISGELDGAACYTPCMDPPRIPPPKKVVLLLPNPYKRNKKAASTNEGNGGGGESRASSTESTSATTTMMGHGSARTPAATAKPKVVLHHNPYKWTKRVPANHSTGGGGKSRAAGFDDTSSNNYNGGPTKCTVVQR